MLEAKNWIKKVYWEDVRDQVAAVNPEFAAEVDKLSPGKDLPLYQFQYKFGEPVLKDGIFQIPDHQGKLFPLTDPQVSAEVKKDFSYAPGMPIGILLNGQLEVYKLQNEIALSLRCIETGSIFGLWALLEKGSSSHSGGAIWHATSGARSLCMLPKISDAREFKRLTKFFGLRTKDIPEKLVQQWPLFVELANSPVFSKPWCSEMIFLSSAWHEKTHNDPAWIEFRLFLHKQGWASTTWLRDQVVFDVLFYSALNESNLRPNPYLADIVKYLYQLANGVYPAFKIATDDSPAPVSQFQEIFTNIYHLDNAPLMAHFASINTLEPQSALYYSLELPTQLLSSPRSSLAENKLADLREIKHIQESVQKYFLQDKLRLQGLHLYHVMKNSKFEYFHTSKDDLEGILESDFLSNVDKDIFNELKKFPNKKFCERSPFFRGCVRISKD